MIKTAESETGGLYARVIRRIKPSREEAFEERLLAERIMERLKSILPGDVRVELAGSIAKNTNLKGDRDFDVFILFPKTYSRKSLETNGLKWAKQGVAPNPWTIGYAEHPYLRSSFEACDVDVVPGYSISSIEEKATSVDRSQLHTKWVKGRVSEAQCDDIRLLKAFLKRAGIYGAELRVEGFSGYLSELLIAFYGSFQDALKAASQWERPVIDVERHYSAREELEKKFDAPLIVIDPVDRNRNVAAVVSETSLAKFIYASRQFLKNPSESFFSGKSPAFTPQEVRRRLAGRKSAFYALSFKAPPVVSDVLWPQLKKAEAVVCRQLEGNGFKLIGSHRWSDEKRCVLLFEFEVDRLPAARKIYGPEIIHAKDFDAFVEKHGRALSGPWIEGMKPVAVEKRAFTAPLEILKGMREKPEKHALPSHVGRQMKAMRILEGRQVLGAEALGAVSEYLSKKML